MAVRRVYIAGALTGPDILANAYLAIKAGKRLERAGFAPLVPHAFILSDLVEPGTPYERWLEIDLAWLEVADAVLRLPGHSPGADREVAYAKSRGIPVFTSEIDLYRAARVNPAQAECRHLRTYGFPGDTRCIGCGAFID